MIRTIASNIVTAVLVSAFWIVAYNVTGKGGSSRDVEADTALMNARLQGYIATMPAQYYWVHKRFKTRPEGEASLY